MIYGELNIVELPSNQIMGMWRCRITIEGSLFIALRDQMVAIRDQMVVIRDQTATIRD